jgi:hypothetical protein
MPAPPRASRLAQNDPRNPLRSPSGDRILAVRDEHPGRRAPRQDRSIINEIDRQRPLGPDGTHGERHTETCGCERPGLRCVHWHDGDNCCRCGAPRDPGVCQGCGSSDCEGCGGPDSHTVYGIRPHLYPRTQAQADAARALALAQPPISAETIAAAFPEHVESLTNGPAMGTVFNCRCHILPDRDPHILPDSDPRTILQMELADLRYRCRAAPGETTLTVNAELKASLVARFGSLELAGVHYGIKIQDGYEWSGI